MHKNNSADTCPTQISYNVNAAKDNILRRQIPKNGLLSYTLIYTAYSILSMFSGLFQHDTQKDMQPIKLSITTIYPKHIIVLIVCSFLSKYNMQNEKTKRIFLLKRILPADKLPAEKTI